MNEPYESNTTLPAIAERLRQAQRVLITTHAKPDGDALGAVVALGAALLRLGKRVERRVVPPVPAALDCLSRCADLVLHDSPDTPVAFEPDLVVVVDTGAWSQLEAMRPWLELRRDRAIVIDHHLRGDDVAAMRLIDTTAGAACELIAELIDQLGVAFDPTIRDALFVGIASDTGWFRFSNCTPGTHEWAARLQREGVDHASLYAATEQVDRPQKLALLTRALTAARTVADGRAIVMVLRAADFDETGAKAEETERLIDVPQSVRAIQVVALVVEQHGGPVRVSLRSKPVADAINVSELAQRFGGGGHARAAGAKVDQPLEKVVESIVAAIEQQMGGSQMDGPQIDE